jgi:hypothetical protein
MKVFDVTKKVNTARVALQNNEKPLEREDIVTILQAAGLPKGDAMISQCIKFGIVHKHGNNKYTFSEKPVYWQKIQNAVDRYHREKNEQNKLYRARVRRNIAEAKSLLQKHGYSVIG